MRCCAIILLPLAATAVVLPADVSVDVSADVESKHVRRQQSPTRGDQLLSKLGTKLYASAKTDTSKSDGILSKLVNILNKGYNSANVIAGGMQGMQDQLEKKLPQIFISIVPPLAKALEWTVSPAHATSVQPVLEPEIARKVLLRYGPFELMGQKYNRTKRLFSMDNKSDILVRQLKGIPQNAAILSGRMDTVFADGSKAAVSNGIYIHHLLVADVGKNIAPFALCPGGRLQKNLYDWMSYHFMSAIGAGFIQSGNDQVEGANVFYTKAEGMKSAFLTGFDDIFGMEVEIVNYNQENTTVYLQLEIEYIPDKPEGYMDASTVLFSATGCGKASYKPESNSKQNNYTSEPFRMDYDGVIVKNRGHLHDGGVAMHMLLNDKLVCESLPTYGSTPGSEKGADGKAWETILSMSQCDKPVPFKQGDMIKLVSIYDTEKHPLRQHASGGHGGHGGHGGDGGHGDMAEEMGIFTSNIAITSRRNAMPPKAPRSSKKGRTGSAPPMPKPAPAAAAHSHGGRSLRSISDEEIYARYGEEIWPVQL